MDGGYIVGIHQDYFSIAGLTIKQGRGITEDDNKNFRQVAVLDETSAKLLFGEDDPIGKTIEISSTPFTIVGVCAYKETFEPTMDSIDDYYTYNQSTGSKVYVPSESWPLFYQFDDARSGGFEPLKEVTPDKKVVLGLVTTKSAKLEDKETVIARIKEASQYVPLENLCLSPQCGFASCEIGNKLTEEEQWAKVKLVKEIAEEVWG